ncbi:MAG: MORN variant repeat protein [Bacteroidetes bacterium]|nr:MAG: MORN variant repeat protein [Bacteroidota bacterium]
MQKLCFFLLASILLASCSNTTVKKEKYDDGKIKSEKTYQKINGREQLVKEVKFHHNGQKYVEGGYKNELRNGHWASWYEDGKIWSEGEFRDGKSHGKRTVYHPNGKKYYEGSFDMGKRIGVWLFYDEAGMKVKEINYSTGSAQP